MEPKLLSVLSGLVESNPHNAYEESVVVDVMNGGRPVVSIFPSQRYAQFHGEYTQVGSQIEELEPLIEHLEAEGYRMNLD